jgi:hypothetical protein
MSERAENEPCSTHYSFLSGVGLVPSGPKSDRRGSMQPDLEEDEVSEVSSHFRLSLSHSQSLRSVRGNDYIVPWGLSSHDSNRQQRQAESLRTTEVRDLTSLRSRGPHDWHGKPARHKDRDLQKGRDRDDHYLSQRRSRSRSPSRRRDHSRDLFTRTGDTDTDRSDSRAPSRAPSIDPPSSIVTPQPQSQSACQCPISDRCRCRPRPFYDCRPLVPIFQPRAKGRGPEYETV